MKLQEIAEEIKNRPLLVEYLKPAKRGYVCPVCGNGSGEDGTGAIVSEDGTRLLCGKCQRGLTNIDVLASYLGKGIKGKEYIEVLKYGMEVMGKEEVGNKKPSAIIKVVSVEMERMIYSDIEQARANLKKLSAKEKRGLTDETLKTFQIGLNENWTPPQKRLKEEKSYASARILIPHLTNPALPRIPLTYCAALLISEREKLEE